jgi:flavin reductase (DIM6/NTAB) family NADH-FMN oxidoreductase RutF
MSIDPKAVGLMVRPVYSPVLAVTTYMDSPGEARRDNGMIALGGGAGSILPEAMRITLGVEKPNFTHEMIMKSQVFVVHLLPTGPEEALAVALEIVKALGGHSGRTHDKIAPFRTKRGVTGAPILLDALLYVECRVAKAFDGDENTIFLGDVVAAERLGKGPALDVRRLWAELPAEWTTAYEHRHQDGLIAAARLARGLS